MKPIDTPKDKNGVQILEPEANEKTAPSVQEEAPEKIDFSNVVIEPLFADQVDFETFSKSDFRAVKVLDCQAVRNPRSSCSSLWMTAAARIGRF